MAAKTKSHLPQVFQEILVAYADGQDEDGIEIAFEISSTMAQYPVQMIARGACDGKDLVLRFDQQTAAAMAAVFASGAVGMALLPSVVPAYDMWKRSISKGSR